MFWLLSIFFFALSPKLFIPPKLLIIMRFGFRLSYFKIIILRSYTCNVYCAVFHSKDVLQRCWITCCFFSFPFWYTNLVFSGHTLSQGIQTNVRNCDVKFRFKQDTFIRRIRLIIRNTLSAGLEHLNWIFNVFVPRKTIIHAFAFAFVTSYLSCQIFLMTYVNWPDKELRPVADSVSFGTDNIGSDIQWYLDAFP